MRKQGSDQFERRLNSPRFGPIPIVRGRIFPKRCVLPRARVDSMGFAIAALVAEG